MNDQRIVGLTSGLASGTGPRVDDGVRGVTNPLVEDVQYIRDDLGIAARDLANGTRELAEHGLVAGKSFAARRIRGLADAVRAVGAKLGSAKGGWMGNIDKAANGIEDVAIYLATRTVEQLVKLLKRKNATLAEKAVAAVLEGAAKPVGGDADAVVRTAREDDEKDAKEAQAAAPALAGG